MAKCYCGWEDRNVCKCSQDCDVCSDTMHLQELCEWPEGKLYCWGCAHDRIAKLEKQVKALKNKQKRVSR